MKFLLNLVLKNFREFWFYQIVYKKYSEIAKITVSLALLTERLHMLYTFGWTHCINRVTKYSLILGALETFFY